MILFENFNEIHKICQEYGITNYTINSDGTIDVDGDVNLYNKKLTKLPLKFRNVGDHFYCSFNKLTTLEGAPQSVGGHFSCESNQLTTLEGAPLSVGGYGCFSCSYNKLTTLVGSPLSVSGGFWCINNNLTTLEGAPISVGGAFYCNNNNLTTLEGAPKSFSGIFCSNNPINSSKYFYAYLEALKCINTGRKLPKELVTPGFMSFLKEIDNPLYNKIKSMFDQDTIDNITDMGDIGF